MGDIPWGTHFCVLYETQKDLMDVLVPFFKAGLDNNEFNLLVISNPYLTTVDEAVAALEQEVADIHKYLESGRLEIFNASEWYLRDNVFDARHVLQALKEKVAAAVARGFEGIRASGDLFWLEQKYRNAFYAYEKQIHDLIADQPVIILCSYPLSKFGGAEVLDIIQAHQFAISRRQGKWELIESPALVRAGGEMKKITELLQVKREPGARFRGMGYLLALLSVGIASIAAKDLINAPVSLFLCAIIVSAIYGGSGPGLLAVMLSLLSFAYYFVGHGDLRNVSLEELSRFLIFALSCFFVVVLVARQTNSARSLRRAHGVLSLAIRNLRETNGALRIEIKERGHTEALLQKKGLEFQAIVENAPDPIIRYDREFRPTYINPAAIRAGTLLTDTLAGNAGSAGVSSEDRANEGARFRRLVGSVFSSGLVQEYEIRLAYGETPTFYNVRLCPEMDRFGTVVNVLCITRDISKRRQTEDELRLAYQRLTYHVENTPLAVIELDKDLNIRRWSPRAEEIFGWKASEALSKNVHDRDFRIIFEEDQEAVNKINEELTQGAVNRNISVNRNYTKSGDLIYCEWYNSVLRDEGGNMITILSLVLDVTERKKAEIILNKSYEEIRQLSNHLQNIREEERSHIAREIHDELGQQLTVLKMDVLGLSRKLNGEDAAIHEKIGEIIGLLDQTVTSVRKISSELRPSLLYNLGLAAAIEWQLKEFEKRSGIKTVFIEPAEEWQIMDPLKNGLFRIFQESLTNAGRHANAGKIIVSLERNDSHLILTVEDDGRGFEIEKIGAKRTLGILGMKERCQMMGGHFEIRSSPGNGTCVMVVVPYDGGK
ncbi:MAG TPA: MEDS domain-containing protein [Puia sp.]|nr:MEDS domain-containing protein [Puia sp.]